MTNCPFPSPPAPRLRLVVGACSLAFLVDCILASANVLGPFLSGVTGGRIPFLTDFASWMVSGDRARHGRLADAFDLPTMHAAEAEIGVTGCL